jgi:hypothetical protein
LHGCFRLFPSFANSRWWKKACRRSFFFVYDAHIFQKKKKAVVLQTSQLAREKKKTRSHPFQHQPHQLSRAERTTHMSVAERIRTVTGHAAGGMQRFCLPDLGFRDMDICTAQVLLAAGRGPARLPTCEHMLTSVRSIDKPGYRSMLLRALALLKPGELRALRVVDPMILDLILSVSNSNDDPPLVGGTSPSLATRMKQATKSLHVVAWSGYRGDVGFAFRFIQQCAATLTELDCNNPRPFKIGDLALACCTRLESFSHADRYTPTAWLGLSQLHTLRGVDLRVAPVAAIASALPRLHTFDAYIVGGRDATTPAAVDGFFERLLPRLQTFHFCGMWPRDEDEEAPHALHAAAPSPLPGLRELVWRRASIDLQTMRRFMGAQPMIIEAPYAVIADWLCVAADENTGAVDGPGSQPLARARELRLTPVSGRPLDSTGVAQLLRAAPQLRRFLSCQIDGDFSWATDPAFQGLVHPWLRAIAVAFAHGAPAPPADCAVCLRRLYFPRLQQMHVSSVPFYASFE